MQINKRLMIIAGGTWQVPLVKKAKELGCFVVNSNLYEDSPGFKYADVTAVADVRDKEKNLQERNIVVPLQSRKRNTSHSGKT